MNLRDQTSVLVIYFKFVFEIHISFFIHFTQPKFSNSVHLLKNSIKQHDTVFFFSGSTSFLGILLSLIGINMLGNVAILGATVVKSY